MHTRTFFLGGMLGLLAALAGGRLPAAESWSRLPADDGASAAAPLPVAVAPDDAALRYSGRFDHTHGREALCAWSASAVTLRFHGRAVNVVLGTGGNRFEVVVDGVPAKMLSAAPVEGRNVRFAPPGVVYSLATGLPDGDHSVTVFKSTEAFVGNATFGGFQLDAGGPDAAARAAAPPVGGGRRLDQLRLRQRGRR